MGIMAERSCAVVRVDRITFLCLLRGEGLVTEEAPFHRDDLSGSPLDGNVVIEVTPGCEGEDFCWVSIGPSGIVAPMFLPQAGVAAALTARLYGLAPGTGRLLGKDLAATEAQVFMPPTGDWWTGAWAAGSGIAPPAIYDATLLMHGEIVVRACPPLTTEPAPTDEF